MGDYLNDRGLTISAPCLPGHGTTPEDLNTYGWADWTHEVELTYDRLLQQCQQVFVAGLSMGALLALQLVAIRKEVLGLITYAAAIDPTDWRRHMPRMLSRIIRQIPKSKERWYDPTTADRLWSYESYPTTAAFEMFKGIPVVRGLLPQVTCPYLSFYCHEDPTISVAGVRRLYDEIGSEQKELVELSECGHVITLDGRWEQVAKKSFEFISRHAYTD